MATSNAPITSSKAALLAFASKHLTAGDMVVLSRRLTPPRRDDDPVPAPDLADLVSTELDDPAATECLRELRRRKELGLPLVPRWG